MMDKYGIGFTEEVKAIDKKRLINQLWKLIPMRENNEDWQGQLSSVIEEVSGLAKIYNDQVESLILLSKLEGLTSKECDDFMVYRKTIFRCIDLLSEVMKDG